MAFPSVASVTQSPSLSGTTHSADLPATVDAGDLLILLHSNYSDVAVSSGPSGWTQLYSDVGGTFVRGSAWAKDADGTEDGGTASVTMASSVAGAAQVYRITGWGGTLGTDVDHANTLSAASTTTPDPPSLSPPWGAADTLWIAVTQHGDDNVDVNSAPTNYTNLTQAKSGGTGNDASVTGSAYRTLNASSENPGSFTIASSESWVAATIAVAPAAAGGPTAPSGLTATLSAVDEIDLAWTDNSSTETGFEIERDSGGGFSLIHTTTANATTYTDTGLSASTTYTYRVRATDGANQSTYTNTDSATTAPAAPTLVTASNPTASTIDVSWTDQTGGAHQHRVLWRETGSGDPWNIFSTVPAGTTTETVTGLTAGTSYDIGVASYDSGADLESAIVFDTETTTGGSGSLTPPSNLSVTGFTATSVSLSWTDETGGFYEHRVYYRTPAGSGGWTLFATLANEFSTDTVTGLDPATEYEFDVRSWDGASESTPEASTVTQTTATARWVAGVHFTGTEGRTVVEADEGAIPGGTGAEDGAGTKTLPKGVRHGTVAHLGSITYAEPYQDAPIVVYAGGGLSMEQRAKWGTKAAVDAGTASDAAPTASGIYQVPVFEGDVSGFTARLYLRNSTTLTAETASIGAPTTLTALGVTGEATPAAGDLPAFDDRYSVPFSGSMTSGVTGSADVTVALEARLNGGAWSQIASVTKLHTFKAGGSTTWNFDGLLAGVISGMDGTGLDQFRCRLVSATNPLGDLGISVTFGPNVEWQSGSPTFASMTPESGDEVSFVVIGNTSSA